MKTGLAILIAFVLAAACTRSGSPRPAPSQGAGVTESATDWAGPRTPQRAGPMPVTPTPTLGPEAVGCDASVLQTAVRGPGGATAMMSIGIVVANTGASTCSLPPPDAVLMLDGSGAQLTRFGGYAQAVPPYVNLRPSKAPADNDASPPEGGAYVSLVWTWQGVNGSCHRLDPPEATLVVELPPAIRLEVPAQVMLGPCESQQTIGGFGPT